MNIIAPPQNGNVTSANVAAAIAGDPSAARGALRVPTPILHNEAGLAKFFNLVTFKNADFVFYEDNISYLKAVCDRFNIRGVYIPSVQGH